MMASKVQKKEDIRKQIYSKVHLLCYLSIKKTYYSKNCLLKYDFFPLFFIPLSPL